MNTLLTNKTPHHTFLRASSRNMAKNAALSLTKNVLSLYDISTYSDEVVEQLYAENASLNDPLIEVQGIENIKAQFRGLSAIAASSTAKLVRGSISGGDTLTIESIMEFSLKPFPRFLKLRVVVFSILDLDDFKILRHTDYWDIKSLVQNIPLVGFVYNRFRPCFGTVSSAVVKRVMSSAAAEHTHSS